MAGPGSGYGDVRIEGLRELNAALKRLDPALQKGLRTSFIRVGRRVAADAKSRMPVRSGRARASVRAGATNRGAYVAEGRADAPYVGWLDWGGVLRPSGRRRNTQVRPRIGKGRYLYPAIEANSAVIRREALSAIEEATQRAGLR